MSKNWTDDIRRRMENYETDAPEGLWEEIEQKLEAGAAAPQKKQRAAFLPLWARYAVGAVAVMTAAFFALQLLNKGQQANTPNMANAQTEQTKDATPSTAPMSEEQPLIAEAAPHTGEAEKYTPAAAIRTTRKSAKETEEQIQEQPIETTTGDIATTALLAETEDVETGTAQTTDVKPQLQELQTQPKPVKKQAAPRNIYAQAAASPKTVRESTPLTLSVFTAGGTSSSFSETSTGLTFVTSAGPEGASWADDPMLGIGVFNQGKEIETDIRHHLPLRVGLTAAYNLTPRFSLETGLVYSLLTADFREGSSSHYVDGKQTLHYIGIPIKAKYTVFSYKRLSIYASAGILTEKRIKGKQERAYVLDNKKREVETTDVHSKPFQFSVNAAAGLQLTLVPRLSLFAEPGISYAFKDGSQVKTIYDEKPFNFDLNIGLRFTLGK